MIVNSFGMRQVRRFASFHCSPGRQRVRSGCSASGGNSGIRPIDRGLLNTDGRGNQSLQAKSVGTSKSRGLFKNDATTEMDWRYLVRSCASGTAVAYSRVPRVPHLHEKNASRMGAGNSKILKAQVLLGRKVRYRIVLRLPLLADQQESCAFVL